MLAGTKKKKGGEVTKKKKRRRSYTTTKKGGEVTRRCKKGGEVPGRKKVEKLPRVRKKAEKLQIPQKKLGSSLDISRNLDTHQRIYDASHTESHRATQNGRRCVNTRESWRAPPKFEARFGIYVINCIYSESGIYI